MPVNFDDHAPATLEDAVSIILSGLTDDERDLVRNDHPYIHMGFGRHMRNGWGLWNGSALRDHFLEVYGLGHADDMSGMILAAVRASVRGETFRPDKKARYYRDFWRSRGVDSKTQKAIAPIRKGLLARLFDR